MPTLPASGVSFTVKTNGQTLLVSAGRDYATLTALLYSDAACTAAVTTPHTITSDTTYYLPPDRAQAAYYVSCKQLDGTELWGRSQHLGGITVEPLPSRVQVAADLVNRELMPTGAIAQTASRTATAFGNTNAQLVSGRLHMTAIFLPYGASVSSISVLSGTTAAVAPTAQWFALYNSSLALLGQTPDDTSTAWAGSTVKTLTFATPITTTYAGLYYLGIMVAAGTVPSLFTTTNAAAVVGIAPKISGYSDTGLTTTAPPSAAAITTQTTVTYAYVS